MWISLSQHYDRSSSLTLLAGYAQSLAAYFGDDDVVPGGMCGKCTFCMTGSGVEFQPAAKAIPDPARIRQILDACPERDDPRLLARMAFGIASPRLTAGKWSSSHPLFGSMVDTDFNALVAAFDVECKKADYARAEPQHASQAPRTSQKRSYTQSSASSSRGGYRGSYGGGYKRGRRGKW